jgi:hypothetical protein
MIRKVRLSKIILVLVIAVSCETSPEWYKKADVQLLFTQIGEDSVTVVYSTPLETLYYSPGVVYEYESNGNLNLKVLRSGISDKPVGSLTKSIFIKNSADSTLKQFPPTSYVVKIPNRLDPACTGKNCIQVDD